MRESNATRRPATDMNDVNPHHPTKAVSLSEMLRCFAFLGVTGFGGVLPIAFHEIVRKRRWLTREEFAEIVAVCQVLPGPNIVNFAIMFGTRSAGWRGMIASVAGLLTLPVAIVLMLATLYSNYSEVPAVAAATRAVASAAAGLVAALSLQLLWPLRANPVALAIVALAFVMMVVLRLSLFVVIACLVPAALIFGYWEHHRAR